jgi:hypothetical protein
MEAKHHLVYSRQQVTMEAARAMGTKPRTVPLFDPPCDCVECQLSYYSRELQRLDMFCYVGYLSDDQARLKLVDFVHQITSDRAYLNRLIEAHGDMILRRWRNRSPSKRRALLFQIDSSLPKESYARVRLEYAPTAIFQHRQKYRRVNLVPYLDAETLSMDPVLLIALLHYRTQFSPAQWSPFDHHQLTVAWGAGLLDAHFNKHCVVMFGDEYGKLVPWNKDAAHRVDIIGFPRGALILEAQAYLMGLLRQLVETISAGPESVQGSGAMSWKQCAASGFKQSGDLYWSNFTFGPFSAPPAFDIDHLYVQAKARRDATADHLALLQTEPSYMRRYAKVVGAMHLIEQNHKNDVGYQMVSNEITGDLAMHWFWLGVCEEFEHARSVYHQYSGHVNPGQPLPKEIDDMLGALEVLLVNAVHQRSMQLQVIISQRPGFSRWYRHDPYDPITKTSGYVLNCSGESSDIFREDPLWWCLMQLQGDPEDQTRFPYAMLFKYLDEHLASATKSERSRLDEILYDKISDYATIIELLAAVRMHIPKCRIRNIHEIKKTEDRYAWRRFKAKSKESTIGYVFASSMKKFQNTPIPSGPRNQQWLQRFDASHETLQNFWKSVHDYYLLQNRTSGYSEQDVEKLMRSITIWKSDEYLGLLATKREHILHEITTRKGKTVSNEDFWLPFPAGVDVVGRPEIPVPKNKAKTRGIAYGAHTADLVPPSSAHAAASVQIALKKRAMKAFRFMFPTTSEERQQTLDWATFVWAMEEAGFKGRNGGGSEVSFEKVDCGGRINFHRPHPDPHLDPVILQGMGQRMNKWFGFTRETFRLAGK